MQSMHYNLSVGQFTLQMYFYGNLVIKKKFHSNCAFSTKELSNAIQNILKYLDT